MKWQRARVRYPLDLAVWDVAATPPEIVEALSSGRLFCWIEGPPAPRTAIDSTGYVEPKVRSFMTNIRMPQGCRMGLHPEACHLQGGEESFCDDPPIIAFEDWIAGVVDEEPDEPTAHQGAGTARTH